MNWKKIDHFLQTTMPSEKPRIHAVLDQALYDAIKKRAEEEGMSLSRKARDLMKMAIEIEEDRALDAIVDRRKENGDDSISHDDFWNNDE